MTAVIVSTVLSHATIVGALIWTTRYMRRGRP